MKQKIKQPEAMIFDLDGTLFKTETSIVPAYHAVIEQLREEGLFTGETPPVDRLLGALGLLLDRIWEIVMPDASEEARKRANVLLLHYQIKGLERGDGELYPHVLETLSELHQKGVRLFVASNGLKPYIDQVIEHKGLAHLFEGLYSAGGYNTASKVDLVRILLEEHQVKSAWMVGDRSSDIEAGKENGLLVIGCDYAGFGEKTELAGSDYIITSFDQLMSL